jgi:3-hydroxyisobutyrate dehydrogenase-like beta-hydroxyacid dehydrogenase
VAAASARPASSPRVALLGLGEAGAVLAADFVAAGLVTVGWDPSPAREVAGVVVAGSAAAAVADADVVLSVNSQRSAVGAAQSVVSVLSARHLFADLNTTSPAVKREIAAVVAPTGAAFADVALLAPVPGRGVRTPSLVSGPGAARFASIFSALGMPVTQLDGDPGDAAARKLLRSVFMKGLAAAIVESLAAAEAAGCRAWLWNEIAETLEHADRALLDRLVAGSTAHARRRTDEMEAAAEFLVELGQQPHVALAAAAVLRELAERPC